MFTWGGPTVNTRPKVDKGLTYPTTKRRRVIAEEKSFLSRIVLFLGTMLGFLSGDPKVWEAVRTIWGKPRCGMAGGKSRAKGKPTNAKTAKDGQKGRAGQQGRSGQQGRAVAAGGDNDGDEDDNGDDHGRDRAKNIFIGTVLSKAKWKGCVLVGIMAILFIIHFYGYVNVVEMDADLLQDLLVAQVGGVHAYVPSTVNNNDLLRVLRTNDFRDVATIVGPTQFHETAQRGVADVNIGNVIAENLIQGG